MVLKKYLTGATSLYSHFKGKLLLWRMIIQLDCSWSASRALYNTISWKYKFSSQDWIIFYFPWCKSHLSHHSTVTEVGNQIYRGWIHASLSQQLALYDSISWKFSFLPQAKLTLLCYSALLLRFALKDKERSHTLDMSKSLYECGSNDMLTHERYTTTE